MKNNNYKLFIKLIFIILKYMSKSRKIISVFDNFPSKILQPLITSNGMKKDFNIQKEIKEKRIEIKKLLKSKIQGDQLYKAGDRIPTPLLKFRNGLKTSFFSYNGLISEKLSSFRKALLSEYLEKRRKLNRKIDAGALTYYYLKEFDEMPKTEKKGNFLRQRILANSHNYDIVSEKEINLDKYKKELETGEIKLEENFFDELFKGKLIKKTQKKINPSTIDNSSQFKSTENESKTNISNDKIRNAYQSYLENSQNNKLILKKNIIPKSEKSKRNSHILQIPSLNINSNTNTINNSSLNDQDYYYQTISTFNYKNNRNKKQNLDFKSYTARTTNLSSSLQHLYNTSNKEINFLKEEKKKSKSLQKRIEFVNKKQKKLEKKLFKIIDRAFYLLPLSIEFTRDAEAITGKKIKYKKKTKGITQENVNQAVRIENDYSHMKKEKAKLMEISDTIVKIDDVTANKLGKCLQESYFKSNYLHKNEVPLKIKLKREKNLQLQRERINKNNQILEKLRYNMDYTFSHLKK